MPSKKKIKKMFDGIAPSYDRLNHLMSLNVDRLWRRYALKEIVDGSRQQILVGDMSSETMTTSAPDALLKGS